jgi:hypothetical protein
VWQWTTSTGCFWDDSFALDSKVAIECLEVGITPTYRLKMTTSALETVIATVSAIGVQGSRTDVLENTPGVSQVGGDRTTSDVWEIRVFDDNSPSDTLTSHYIIRILRTSTNFGIRVWKNSGMNFSLT